MLTFTANGNKNILSTHRNTIEFTHHNHLTKKGDCILGVDANYSLDKIKEANFSGKIKIRIAIDHLSDEITAEYNPLFDDPEEMVIRISDYTDKRTFATRANKAAKDINRELVEKMKQPDAVLKISMQHY